MRWLTFLIKSESRGQTSGGGVYAKYIIKFQHIKK